MPAHRPRKLAAQSRIRYTGRGIGQVSRPYLSSLSSLYSFNLSIFPSLRDLCQPGSLSFVVTKTDISSLRAVAVQHLHPISRFLQPLGHIFGDHYRPVLAAGAAESNGQIAFALVNVMRQEVNKQIRDALDELGSLRKRADVFCDLGMPARERAKFRHEMRVGEKTNIKDQIGIIGNALLESEADAGNQNVFALFFFLKELINMSAQLVHIELRGINHQVSDGADGA